LHSFEEGVAERRGGEKLKKAAVAVLGLALSIMLVASASAVMAKSEKVPVVGLSLLMGGAPPEREWETNGGVEQFREAWATGAVYYWFDRTVAPPPAPYNSPPPTYKFNQTSELNGMTNSEAGVSVSHWKCVLRYPLPALGPELGRFEGIMTVKSDGTLTTMHVVYQGSGRFEGQTLMVTGTKLGGQPGVIEGFLLTR
jgi:hypothetical protein